MAPEFYNVAQANELEGFERQRERGRERAVLSTVELLADVRRGRVPYYLLAEAFQPRTPAIAQLIARNYPGIINFRETMTRSDFPLLMSDTMGRVLLARFAAFPQAWRMFVGVAAPRRDFRNGAYLTADGLEGAFPEQGENDELTYGGMTEASYAYGIRKYAKGAKLSWELLVNDDLGAFDTIPDRLGRGAARTLARYVTTLYAAPTGPNATFFSAGNKNLVTGNPPLSLAALATAFGQMRSQVDSEGEPIMIESAVLVVGPGLEVTARNILASTQIWPVSTTGGPVYDNWLTGNLSLAVDPYIPIITTTGTVGATSWYLFANPTVARPAIEMSFLSGFESPVLYQKLANTARLGGGIDQMAGDFNTMSSEYKAIIAFGGSLLDPKSAMASPGQ